MSINKKRFSRAAVICAEILLAALILAAQDFEANIVIKPASPAVAQIEGRFYKLSNVNWSFLKNAAGADNLGARISDFKLFDRQNQSVAVKKLIDGEYLASNAAIAFRYEINLKPTPIETTKARVSWISAEEERGILMLDDLLPQFSADVQPSAAKIKIELPDGWTIISNEKPAGANVYQVENISKAIFVVGKDWRETKTARLNLAISGEWQFTDAEAAQMADEIYERYEKLFGEPLNGKAQIVLARLSKQSKFGRWEAETRGRTVTIASADKPFKSQSIQLLHEQLRHELFHLWIPNNLNLRGNYDWFYEGYTVYQALRTGVQTNQIRFEDFLATLAEAYRLDDFQTNRVSLLESSKNRWNKANSTVYARGMLVAFLCDAAILRASKGRRSIENLFQDVYRTHRYPNEAADGNAAISSILKNDERLASIVKKYVEGAEKINWASDLEAFGIEATTENDFFKLAVKSKLNGRQKDLLDKLGYNNWRKISQKTKR